jgi:hypothetical protein
MLGKLRVILAGLVLAISGACADSHTADQPSRTVSDLVDSLGPDTRPEDLKPLRQNGRAAVTLLIATLQPIPEEKVLQEHQNAHRETMHVVWALRALRYLTGQDFRAPTAHVFGDAEDERTRAELLKKDDATVPFFATWMSRDSVYIAPVDAQRAIIEAWRRWLSQLDENWTPISEPGINDWYF